MHVRIHTVNFFFRKYSDHSPTSFFFNHQVIVTEKVMKMIIFLFLPPIDLMPLTQQSVTDLLLHPIRCALILYSGTHETIFD